MLLDLRPRYYVASNYESKLPTFIYVNSKRKYYVKHMPKIEEQADSAISNAKGATSKAKGVASKGKGVVSKGKGVVSKGKSTIIKESSATTPLRIIDYYNNDRVDKGIKSIIA